MASGSQTDERTPLMEEGGQKGEGKKKKEKGIFRSALDRAQEAGVNLTSTLGDHYNQDPSTYDKIFMKDVNRSFGDHLEVASRGACFVVICAFPFVAPHAVCPMCEALVESEIYTAASITYFIYTLYVYTGDILHFAQGGIVGSFLAVLSIWMMQGFMPGGYTASMPHRWYLGSLWGICFVFLILWLNFDDNTRIFSLSTYVWYWMAFLKPDANAGFAQNFEIKFNGKAMRELMVAIAGCSIAVIAGYFPYPIYAHHKALRITQSMMDQIYMAKLDFVEYYCGTKKDELQTKILAREAQALRDESGSISSLLDTSWYECMGSGVWHRQQIMMKRFAKYVTQTIDLLSNAFNTCLDESFDEQHRAIMSGIKSDLDAVIEHNGKVMQVCLAILVAAECDATLRNHGQEQVDQAKKRIASLTTKFRQERLKQKLALVNDDITGENVVTLTFAKFTEETEVFFKKLQLPQEEKHTWKDGSGIVGIFKPDLLVDPDHVSWTLRNGLSILLAFYGGLHGYGQYISSYNAALASTVCVLLSKFVGSAMTKNLSRLQGVVIGIVLGNLLYAFLAWCYWWGHLLVGLALYFWTLMGLFLYFHSTNYATVGILLVVFGTSGLLRPCANEETNPTGHTQIVDVTCAIVIMSVVDLFMSRERASDMAIKALSNASEPIKEYLENLFDPNVPSMKVRKGELADLINTAKGLGNEAALEPRYWRRDWATDTFNQGITCLATIRFCINAIESAVLLPPVEEGEGENKKKMRKKCPAFLKALSMNEFAGSDGVKEILKTHFKNVMDELETTMNTNSSTDVFVMRMGELKNYKSRETAEKWNPKITEFCEAINKQAKVFPQGDPMSIKDDTLAQFSVLVECLKAMFVELDSVLDAIVA